MSRKSLLQGRIRAEIELAEQTCLTPEYFGAAVLRALAGLVPHDDARLFGVDAGSLLLNRLIAASASDDPYRAYWLRHIYLSQPEDGYFGPHQLMRISTGAITYHPRQEECWGMPEQLRSRFTPREHTRFFHQTRTPPGGSMRTFLKARGQWIGMIDLVRREQSIPLSASEFATVSGLAPLIARGLDASLIRELASGANRSGNSESGVLLIAQDRTICYYTPAADRYLAAIHDNKTRNERDLPTSLLALTSACLSPDRKSASRVIDVPSMLGPLRMEATAGRDPGSLAIVIAPVHQQRSIGIPSDWPLTERQRQVVAKLIDGASTKTIAHDLFVSVPTVESHLGHIYEALGVSGRTALLSRFFRETILPQLDAAGTPIA